MIYQRLIVRHFVVVVIVKDVPAALCVRQQEARGAGYDVIHGGQNEVSEVSVPGVLYAQQAHRQVGQAAGGTPAGGECTACGKKV